MVFLMEIYLGKSTWAQAVFFFFGRENESGRENRFLTFFCIFSRAKSVFHAHFFSLFSLFSRLTGHFSRAKTGFFEFFSRAQKKISRAYFRGFLRSFCVFHGYFCWFFSRPLIFFSRVPFGDYFHGQKLIFTRTFVVNFRFFHGHFLFFTCKNPKISKIFTGVFFFSRPKKKTLFWLTYVPARK